MNPTDSGTQYPDLRLDLIKKIEQDDKEIISSLQYEDVINFTAKFL